MREQYARAFALDNIEIVSRAKGGDGRTVEAYAAVFNTPTEVHDRNGDYMEIIHPTAFNRTLSQGAVTRSLYLFNHGLGVTTGQPDSLAQVPIGSPKSIQADGRGLRTVATLNRSALADATLEAVKNGDIRGYSFRGNAYRSDPQRTPKVKRGDALPTVTRMELSLADFGPTPTPYYEKAEILAVRSMPLLLSGMSEQEIELLRALLLGTTPPEDSGPEDATDHRSPGPEDPAPHVARSSRDKDMARQRELALWADLRRMEMAIK